MRRDRNQKYTQIRAASRKDLEPHTKPPVFMPFGSTDPDQYIVPLKSKQGWEPLHFVANKEPVRRQNHPIVDIPHMQKTQEYEFANTRNTVFIPVDRHFERKQSCFVPMKGKKNNEMAERYLMYR